MVDKTEILDLFLTADADHLTTPEVADMLDISKPGAWRRLSDLAERGFLKRALQGSPTVETWSLTEQGRSTQEADTESVESQ